jgi:hypothetical protein
MDGTVRPVNVVVAATMTQILLIVVLVIGAAILSRGERTSLGGYSVRFSWFILLLFLVTMGALVFSQELTPIWQPLFGGVVFPSLPSAAALFLMFTLDILCVAALVWMTGGSQRSAFSAIFFILPALAIFLRQSLWLLVVYVTLVGGLFSVTLGTSEHNRLYVQRNQMHPLAYWFVAISCLALTTFVGYVTRPR